MNRVAELMGHTERVLQTCLSPDTSTLVSAGADETLRFVNMDVCYDAFMPRPLMLLSLDPDGTDNESLSYAILHVLIRGIFYVRCRSFVCEKTTSLYYSARPRIFQFPVTPNTTQEYILLQYHTLFFSVFFLNKLSLKETC